ncbi:MAG: Clp protease N-terminal domain-containing protein [Caldilineaceae bacterium]
MTDKLDRFTKRARRALTLAKEEATRLQQREIDTEHLLLGLLAEKEGLAVKVLDELGCDRRAIQQRVEERVAGPQPARWPWNQPTLAHGAKRVIEFAVDMARQLGHKYIGTEHLLLGLLEEGEGTGAQVLQEFATSEAIVTKITALVTGATAAEARATAPARYFQATTKVETAQEETTSFIEHLLMLQVVEKLARPLGPQYALQQWVRDNREEVIQAERNRLARDLHDSVKQQLFSISISAAAVRERLENDPAGAVAALADVQQSAQAAMVEIDALLHQLSPAPLATIGLIEALREQCEALGYRTGAAVTTTFGTLPPTDRLPTGTQEAIFRMAQEALSNVARHARANEVQVQLELVADENLLRLEVQYIFLSSSLVQSSTVRVLLLKLAPTRVITLLCSRYLQIGRNTVSIRVFSYLCLLLTIANTLQSSRRQH